MYADNFSVAIRVLQVRVSQSEVLCCNISTEVAIAASNHHTAHKITTLLWYSSRWNNNEWRRFARLMGNTVVYSNKILYPGAFLYISVAYTRCMVGWEPRVEGESFY